jgi:4-hydroxy-tetrahydrodipicolinate synthase
MAKAMTMKATNKKKNVAATHLFGGVITALVTPFKRGKVDWPSMKRLVRHQLDNGVAGFVVNGTTAESPTLERSEVEQIFKFVKKVSDGSIPLLMGTGNNSTKETIARTKAAKKIGADGALVVVPYYNKPPQRGLVAHFREVALSTNLPVLLYNVPGRTIVSMNAETVLELSKIKNIVGIKEASGKLNILNEVIAKVPSRFLLTSGDDISAINFMINGGRGVISVISHVIPKDLVGLSRRACDKDEASVTEYEKFTELNRLMGIESNPMPVKMALHLMGLLDSPELRLPLVTLSDANKKDLRAEMKRVGVI